ncbi:MAG: LysR family transcriptional regulator substrate-binding protein [Clostridiales bacterium]|nr:LysR family transcriptional regulator substrate-binding protein [Clostridiales bacterium]
MSPRRIIGQFESGNLDMAIVYESEFQGHTELKSLPLYDRKLDVCLFISGKHPLAKKQTVTLQDLKDVPIGILGEGYSLDFKRLTQQFFEYNRAESPSEYEVYESRRDLEINLIAGRCAAIVYETMFEDRDHKLKAFPVDVEDNSFGISLFWQKDEMRTKAAALWRIIKEKMSRDRY